MIYLYHSNESQTYFVVLDANECIRRNVCLIKIHDPSTKDLHCEQNAYFSMYKNTLPEGESIQLVYCYPRFHQNNDEGGNLVSGADGNIPF